MSVTSIEPPFRRPFPLAKWFPNPTSPARRAWDRSTSTTETIRSRIDELDEPALAAVAISGSLGRMEAREDSDWDLIFLYRSRTDLGAAGATSRRGARKYERSLSDRVAKELFRRPDPKGIFATPIAASELADPQYRGALDDSPSRFGKRIQLLLDAQPIWGDPLLGRVAAFRFYGIAAPGQEERAADRGDSREGILLFNDLVRYHRTLCAATEWLTKDDPVEDRRLKMKLKLRFTRFLNYLGLLLPLAQAIDRGNVAESLARFWNLTPLERILTFADSDPDAARELCRSYESFLAFLEQTEPSNADWLEVEGQADRFRRSACELLRSQPFLQRGRAADLLLL